MEISPPILCDQY